MKDKTKMTPKLFNTKYYQVKPLVKGHGPEIARDAGVKLATYYNATRGLVSDPDVLDRIWGAIRDKVVQLTQNIPTNI